MQRVENAKEAIKACQEVMEKYGLPVVIAGDLNCGPGATQGLDGYNEMIKGGMIDVRHTATESTDLHTHHCDVKLDENGIAYGGEMPNLTLDHAFLSHKCADIVFNKVVVLTEEDALNSSDHCPLLIEYTVK